MYKALFIDDNPVNNHLTRLNIEFDNIPVDPITVESAEEGLQHLSHCMQGGCFPSFIFLDLNMPAMNGFEFVQHYEAKFKRNYPNTRLYLMTLSIRETDEEKAMSYESVHGFYSKPFTVEIFNDVLGQLN